MSNNRNMKQERYTNRYSDVYTFTPDSDGNLLWEGEFKWCRFGMPNDYTKAYQTYVDDTIKLLKTQGPNFKENILTMEEFKEKVHEHFHEDGHPMRKYVMLIESQTNKINMVDPSGGPYISVGMDAGIFHKAMKGKKVVDFERISNGYKLILK